MSHAKGGARGVKRYIRLPICDGNKPNVVLNEVIIMIVQNIRETAPVLISDKRSESVLVQAYSFMPP